MRTQMLSIISIGITIGFLLGMGVVALLRSLLDGQTPGLEVAFMANGRLDGRRSGLLRGQGRPLGHEASIFPGGARWPSHLDERIRLGE